MTKRTYRRLLLLAITLVMALSLISSGSRPQVAKAATCAECLDQCQETYYYNCQYSSERCHSFYIRCVNYCYSSGTCTGTSPYQ